MADAPSQVQEKNGAVCECGHPIAEHAWSGWGEHTVCVEPLADENAGWYGVCPCVRHGDEYPDAGRGEA